LDEDEEDEELESSYLDMERKSDLSGHATVKAPSVVVDGDAGKKGTIKQRDLAAGRVVDVVLSDMYMPFPQTSGHSKNSINDVYRRLMNVSGNEFRDHVKSMVCLTLGADIKKRN